MSKTLQEASPVVSVIMPVHRPDAKFFPIAVRSVLGQSFGGLELIIVEDPSNERGRSMLDHELDPRIRYIENPVRTSLVAQRNRALSEAKGDFIAFLDADDIAEPERLARQLAFFNANPHVDVLGTQIKLIGETGELLGLRTFPTGHADIMRSLLRIVPLSQPSSMVRRCVLEKIGGYHRQGLAVAEDYELWSRLAQAGAYFANHEIPLTRYRIHRQQMKATHLRKIIWAVIQIKRKYWWADMDGRARLRVLGELLMLCLPVTIVLRLLLWTEYRTESFVSHCPLAPWESPDYS